MSKDIFLKKKHIPPTQEVQMVSLLQRLDKTAIHILANVCLCYMHTPLNKVIKDMDDVFYKAGSLMFGLLILFAWP